MEKDDRRNGPILTKVESSQIFGNIEEIYHLHVAIADQLDRALNEDACIGSVFLANVSVTPPLSFHQTLLYFLGRWTPPCLSTLHEVLWQDHSGYSFAGEEQLAFLCLSQSKRSFSLADRFDDFFVHWIDLRTQIWIGQTTSGRSDDSTHSTVTKCFTAVRTFIEIHSGYPTRLSAAEQCDGETARSGEETQRRTRKNGEAPFVIQHCQQHWQLSGKNIRRLRNCSMDSLSSSRNYSLPIVIICRSSTWSNSHKNWQANERISHSFSSPIASK